MSKDRKWLLSMGLAFGPMALYGILSQLGIPLPEWTLIPIIGMAAVFSGLAYFIRISP